MAKARNSIPDCLTCGICCVAPTYQTRRGFADLRVADEKRMGVRLCNKYVIRTTAFDMLVAALDGKEAPSGVIRISLRVVQDGPLRGMELPPCSALQGSPMHRVKCAIYDKRPDVCRNAVVPGDKVCVELRNIYAKFVAKEAREEKGKRAKTPTARRSRRVQS